MHTKLCYICLPCFGSQICPKRNQFLSDVFGVKSYFHVGNNIVNFLIQNSTEWDIKTLLTSQTSQSTMSDSTCQPCSQAAKSGKFSSV